MGLPTGITPPVSLAPELKSISSTEQMVRNLPSMTMKELEQLYIQKVLLECGGCIMKAERVLKLSRATLYRKISAYGLDRGKKD